MMFHPLCKIAEYENETCEQTKEWSKGGSGKRSDGSIDNNSNEDLEPGYHASVRIPADCPHIGLYPYDYEPDEGSHHQKGNNEGDLPWIELKLIDFTRDVSEDNDLFFNNEPSRLNNQTEYESFENNSNFFYPEIGEETEEGGVEIRTKCESSLVPVVQESEGPRQRLHIDVLIDNVGEKCWKKLQNHVDADKRKLLEPDKVKTELNGISWNPGYEGNFFKNKGLLHAIIKHGGSFNFMTFEGSKNWLEALNNDCQSWKNEKDESKKDAIEEKISMAIEANFESIVKLSKQLGNHLQAAFSNRPYPVIISSSEKKSEILVYYKIYDELKKKERYYMFVLADGSQNYAKFDLVTAYRMRPGDFRRTIKRNGITPENWINYNTGQIYKQTPDSFKDSGVYICFDDETIDNPNFTEFFYKAHSLSPKDVPEEEFKNNLKKSLLDFQSKGHIPLEPSSSQDKQVAQRKRRAQKAGNKKNKKKKD